ncbi:MAG: GNAT family N-acetyltransferase [Firmicutes bacterium]|nr:GNAT family N-acetyltransferase [Bacillota bacterium]
MELKLGELSKENVKEICTWNYSAPYDVYNWPDWDEMDKSEPSLDNKKRKKMFYSILDDKDFIGFVELNYPKEGLTRIGLGLRPDYCSKGIGKEVVDLIINKLKSKHPENKIDLEVLTWNKRALKVYKRTGFKIVETYERKTPTGIGKFHRMEYKI